MVVFVNQSNSFSHTDIHILLSCLLLLLNPSTSCRLVDNHESALMGLGMLAGASSFPFFVVSAINKKKANKMAFNFKFEKANYLRKTGFTNINFPVLSFKVSLK